MYFKRLEIQGYKSFATRTVFEIDPGMTAVVGPNGSGKSNIMDALRWVLGETATSQMRAKRLEEVIFAGSETRAPTGMAEVRLVLDNSEHWLPVDFNEVAVTRRVHRNGESDFLLNDNRVRLRDIQEMFQRSGLGPGSYALMGQGLVEEVLRLKPEERRGLIEEVADVRRHRIKMVQARKKREQTRENLERARLLVEEIEPRARTLERQAKRALQHAELSNDLQHALRRYYGRESRRLQSELQTRKAAAERATLLRDQSAQAVETAEHDLEQWREAIRVAREAYERASAERRRLSESLRELEHAQEIARQRQPLLGRRADELSADLAALATEAKAVDETSQAAAEGTQHATTLAADGDSARATLVEAEGLLRQTEGERDTLRERAGAVDALTARHRDAEAQESVRRDRIASERESIEPTTTTRAERIVTLRMRVGHAQEAANAAASVAAEAGRDADEAREQREELVQRFYAAGAYLRNLEAARADRERRLARARDRLELLRELQAESEGMNQGLRALFGSRGVPHADEPSGIPGVVGVIRHLVRSPRGLERAIEAALGDYIDAVIFETGDDASNTIQALLTERAGRIVALPTDEIRHRSPLALPGERGVVGVASALVKCDSRYRQLVDTLIGRVIVVEDLQTGRQIIKRGLGTVVTRDGNLLRANGAIAGGVIAEAGAFTRENELQSLPEEIEHLERSLAESANIEERRTELEQIESDLREAESSSERRMATRVEAQQESAARQAEVVRMQAEIESLEAESTRAASQLTALRREEASLDAARERRREASAEAEAKRPSSEALSAVEARREQQSRRVGGLETSIAEREVRLGQARTVLRASLAADSADAGEAGEASKDGGSAADGALPDGGASGDDGMPEARVVTRLSAEETPQRERLQRCQHEQINAERVLVAAESTVHETDGVIDRLRDQMQSDELRLDAAGRVVGVGEPSVAHGEGEAGEPVEGEQPLDELREQIEALRGRLRWLGNVNPDAATEYTEVKERFDFLSGQIEDLEGAERRMLEAEAELAELIEGKFTDAFNAVDHQFRRYFQTMFRGGSARLQLSGEEGDELPGVEIVAQPPGKRVESLNMLSGGERALTAIALLLAMLEVNPAPFCVLDEVDAALDEANVERFLNALKTLGERTQFVLITHNRRSIEQADSIYGITMGEDSVSRVLSVRLADLELEE
jgi:chromosome segregation protein